MDDDCIQCVQKTGKPCWWVSRDECSACRPDLIREAKLRDERVARITRHMAREAVSKWSEDQRKKKEEAHVEKTW